MNLGSIYDKLDKIDKQIIMSSLSWVNNFSANNPEYINTTLIIKIKENSEYNKLIFLNLNTINYILEKEISWALDTAMGDDEDIDEDDPIEYQISHDNPDKIEKLLELVKKALK